MILLCCLCSRAVTIQKCAISCWTDRCHDHRMLQSSVGPPPKPCIPQEATVPVFSKEKRSVRKSKYRVETTSKPVTARTLEQQKHNPRPSVCRKDRGHKERCKCSEAQKYYMQLFETQSNRPPCSSHLRASSYSKRDSEGCLTKLSTSLYDKPERLAIKHAVEWHIVKSCQCANS